MDTKISLRHDALEIARAAINDMHPSSLLPPYLKKIKHGQNIFIFSIGKAAWPMAKTVWDHYQEQIIGGIVITKYNHSEGPIGNLKILEAGHPFPDENSLQATEQAIEMLQNLHSDTKVVLLISGGGSALLEKPLPGVSLQDVNFISQQLMNSGADIFELNLVRKHLSAVKGGRLYKAIFPKEAICFILSDVIGDDIRLIASGPVFEDHSSPDTAMKVLKKYQIPISEEIENAIRIKFPIRIPQFETFVIGNCGNLCLKAKYYARKKSYETIILKKNNQQNIGETINLLLENYLKYKKIKKNPFALIVGGEMVMKIRGHGKGGRNQHLSLFAASKISGWENIVILAIASDGTDGPTEAAGGLVDGRSWQNMIRAGLNPEEYLLGFDSYHGLKAVGDLVVTGPTGTNVNDLIILLSK